MTDVLQIGSPIVMVCVGAVFLIFGYRLVKVVAVVCVGVLGVSVGHTVARAVQFSPVWGAVIGGAMFALLAIPLLRVAVGLAAGALAGLIAKSAWTTLGGEPPLQWAALAGGFVLGTILALVFFRFIVITTSAVMGAGLIVYGAASLVAGRMVAAQDIQQAEPAHAVACAGAFVALALAGMLSQYRGARRLRARQAAG
jgi:hypothetical protein